jgi:shikimate kinase
MSNIILIGFMGVGKGTIAREFSKKSGRYTIDTDDLIESLENRKIKKIFEQEGEPYFRELEKKTAIWLEETIKNTIISTGGGFYKQDNIKNIGKIIYLKSSFDGILNRIYNSPNAKQKLKKRPLLQDLDKAKEIYNQRVVEYEKISDFIVDVEDRDMDRILDEIGKI